MTARSKSTTKRLPPPTPSEAAFEKILEEFDSADGSPDPKDPDIAAPPNEDGGPISLNGPEYPDIAAPSGSAHVTYPSRRIEIDGGPTNVGGAEVRPERLQIRDAVVGRLFAQRDAFLEFDPFSGIGQRESFPTKIVGVSFEGRQDVAAGMLPGLELRLDRQPANPVDVNAIAVSYGQLQLGFLRKQIAKHLAPLIDSGARYRARIEHVTGGGHKNYGINIRVERERSASAAFDVASRAAADRAALCAALIGEARLRPEQEAVLDRLEAGKNALAVFGTGRGKSFCFQFPAAYRALEGEQKTLVLYPLRALANDQHDALSRRLDGFGLRILRANGAIAAEERGALMEALASGKWDIVLATPEFFSFHRERFSGPSVPQFVVVDEAHHTFESKHRAAYAKLGETIEALGKPQVLALTATAGDQAFARMRRELRIDSWVIDPTIRENLRVIDARGSKDKLGYLRRVFADGGKAIVYCNSRTEATKIAVALRKEFGDEVMFYHARMPSADRADVEGMFRSGGLRIIVATSAFGEGIDLPDVRHVVLYHLNFNFTEFNQQAGRAGRDGGAAQIHLLFSDEDRRVNEFIIDRESPTLAVLREMYRGVRGLAREAIVRLTTAEIAPVLDLAKVNERTVAVAFGIFEEEGLLESGIDDDGRFVRFLSVDGKIDLTRNERFAEGEAERESFARFADFVLSARAQTLERMINRPIYPGNVELQR